MTRDPRGPRPKIALTANTAWYLWNFRQNLIKALSSDHEVVVVASRDGYERALEGLGCSFHHVGFHRGGASLVREIRSQWELFRLYRRVRPDILLNFTPKGNIFGTLASIGTGAIVINNISGLGRAFSPGPRHRWIRRISVVLYRIIGRLAYHTFYQNGRDLSYGLSEGFSNRRNSSRLPGSGVDLARFTPAILPKDGPVTFLHVARLMEEKGTFHFLEAASDLRRLVGSQVVRLEIAGPTSCLSNSETERFHRLCRDVDVAYLGMVDNIETVLSGAHCVVLPSTYAEGVPRSLIEAAAVGKVLICFPNAGCEEIVRDGRNGFVTDSRTVEALSRAMLSVVRMPSVQYLSMCRASIEIASSEFDEQRVIQEYMRLITTSLGGRIGPSRT